MSTSKPFCVSISLVVALVSGLLFWITPAAQAAPSECIPGTQSMTPNVRSSLRDAFQLKVDNDADITDLYKQGKAVIWYRNGDHSEFFTKDSFFLGERIVGWQTINVWGLKTSWVVAGHWDWQSGDWTVTYSC